MEHVACASRFVAAAVPSGGKISWIGVGVGVEDGVAVVSPIEVGATLGVDSPTLALAVPVAETSLAPAMAELVIVAPLVASTVDDAPARTVGVVVAV